MSEPPLTGRFAFVGDLDLEQLAVELEERGAITPLVRVTADDAGGTGHALLRDAVRRAFTHGAIDAGRLARLRGR